MASSRSSRYGEVRKINIVYFLSRGGQVEHPHLLKVYPVVQSRVRLKDIKRWLSKVRGTEMPDSFSWSYKRRYKTGYVWQDLCDDDLITPMSDNEYILKGSEILMTPRGNCKGCAQGSQQQNTLLEDVQDEKQPLENSKLVVELDLSASQENSTGLEENRVSGYSSDNRGQKSDNCNSFNEDYKLAVEYITKLNGATPSVTPSNSGELVRVYRAVTSPASVPIMDAEAQTGESQRMSFGNGEEARANVADTVQDFSPDLSPKKNENHESQVRREEVLSPQKIDNHEPHVSGRPSGGPLRDKTEKSRKSRDLTGEPIDVETAKPPEYVKEIPSKENTFVPKQETKNDSASENISRPAQSNSESVDKAKSNDSDQSEKGVFTEPKSQERFSKSQSRLSCVRNDAFTFHESGQPSPKSKKAAASHVLKQLFTCGSTETKTIGAKNLKVLSLARTFSNECRISSPRASEAQVTTPKTVNGDTSVGMPPLRRANSAAQLGGHQKQRCHGVDNEPNDKTRLGCKCRISGRSNTTSKTTGSALPGQQQTPTFLFYF